MDIKIIDELKKSFSSDDKTYSEKIERFFSAHGGFFDCAPKQVCFLTGVLARKVLNIQFKENNATPFQKKLHGLRLSESVVKNIFKEAQAKLEQYKKNYYRELETVISQYMTVGDKNWPITNDEISFYFTTGLNLADLFKIRKEEEDNDGPDK